MKSPNYRWICHKCGSSNEANTQVCTSCGFSAITSGEAIDKSNPNYDPEKVEKARTEAAQRFVLFFPEGILGAILILITPFWAISLTSAGHIGAALLLLVGVGFSAYVFILSMKQGQPYIAYFVTIGALILAYAINAITQ